MADVIELGAMPMDAPSDLFGKPKDGVVLWGGFQLPPAIVQLNRSTQTTAAPRTTKAARPRKPLLFIHNLKSHRKTGE
ncbi:hypothetical protein [Pyruvatibacter sp.]